MPTSPAFKSFANKVKDALLPALRKSLPSVADILVYAFVKGSVVAKYNIIMDSNAPKVNLSKLESGIRNVITSGNVTGLKVNTSFIPEVKGETLMMIA